MFDTSEIDLFTRNDTPPCGIPRNTRMKQQLPLQKNLQQCNHQTIIYQAYSYGPELANVPAN